MTFSAYNRPKSALEIGAEIAHDFRPGAVNLVPLNRESYGLFGMGENRCFMASEEAIWAKAARSRHSYALPFFTVL